MNPRPTARKAFLVWLPSPPRQELQDRKFLSIFLMVIGAVVFVADVAYILHLKVAHPARFKLFVFHPLLDLIVIVGIVLVVVGVILFIQPTRPGTATPSDWRLS
jgi:uncharacterized membrane protein YidH (DUF202 family)